MRSRPQQVIRFQQKGDKIMLRSVSYNSVADEEDPIYQSVVNNNFEPIIMVFDITAIDSVSSAPLIDVTPLFTKDVAMIGPLSDSDRKRFGIKRMDEKRSMISSISNFPKNFQP